MEGVIPVSPSHVPPTAAPEGEGTRVEELSPPPETTAEERAKTTARPSGWTAGRITALVIGALLVLLSLVLLGTGGTALWADRTQRDAGYATTDVHTFSTDGSALATVSTELGSAGAGWLYAPALLGDVRIRVTPASSGQPLFVGIGPSTEVDRYLAGVDHTVITEFWGDKTEDVAGGPPESPPGGQDFWVASSTGSGARTLVWDPADGSWTVVVMNANGQPGIDVGADLGAKVPSLPWIAIGFLAVGAILMAGGALLIVASLRRRRTDQVSTA
jgi:hypothetical protein